MTIGQRVKMLRIKKEMTQQELAAKLGYNSKSSVAHIENGRDIPRSMVVKLAKALDTTPAFLMGWEETPVSATLNGNTITLLYTEKKAPTDDGRSKKTEKILNNIALLDDEGLDALDNIISNLVAVLKAKGKGEE